MCNKCYFCENDYKDDKNAILKDIIFIDNITNENIVKTKACEICVDENLITCEVCKTMCNETIGDDDFVKTCSYECLESYREDLRIQESERSYLIRSII